MKRRYPGLAAALVLLALTGTAVRDGSAQAGIARAHGPATAAAASSCPPDGQYGDPLPAPAVSATLVRDGFAFTEGPTWVADPGYLLFSDMQSPAGAQAVQPSSIWRFTPPDTFERYIPDSGSNGLAVNGNGTQIIAATHDQRSVSSFNLSDRSRTVVAADYLGQHFNSPNDLTIAADGTIYFTDPNYQRGNRADEMAGTTGVFRVHNGQVELVDGTLSQPNGIALSPDGTTLYVAATAANQIVKYPVLADGSIGPRSVFAVLNSPDGVTIDCAGNLYWASYADGMIHVLAPDGTQLGTVTAARNTTNAAFGGPDGQTLFITSGTPAGSGPANFAIYSARLNIPGNPF
jgi:gluconolactonase